jgi:lysophospholipase L1-like esterase/tetratricopeptide (TPR) repeat protein
LAASLSALLALSLLALLEGALRLSGLGPPPLPSPFRNEGALGSADSGALPDRELFYRLRPGIRFLDYYGLNALGYRGPDVPRERSPGALRVVCTGDSSTFGLGVPEERAWPFVLQRLLQAATDAVRVELIDAGVPGYTSLQNRVQVERDLLALRPDVLLWLPMGHNDDARVAGRDDRQALRFRRGPWFLLSRLALASALGLRLDTATPADAGAAVDALAAGHLLRPRVPLADFEDNLRAVAAACRAAGVPLVLLAPPHDEPVRRERPNERAAEEVVVRVARELGLPLADPRAALDALAPRPLYTDTVHPNADGHALIAWSAFATLAREVALPWPAPAGDFARAWADVREQGLLCGDGRLQDFPGAPALVPLRAALAEPDADLRLAARDPALPPALLRHDPLLGELASPLDLGRFVLLALSTETAPGDGDLERRRLLEDHVRPPSALATLTLRCNLHAPDVPDAHEAWQDLARALAAFEGALDLAAQPRDTRLDAAQRLTDAGDHAGALALIAQVLELDPACAEALAVRGQALERQGDRSGALAAFEAGAALEPDSPTGLFLLGRAQLQRGENALAEPSLRRALELDPAHKLARLALVHALLRLERPDEAGAQLRALQALGAGTLADIPGLQAAIAQKRAGQAAPP